MESRVNAKLWSLFLTSERVTKKMIFCRFWWFFVFFKVHEFVTLCQDRDVKAGFFLYNLPQ